MLSRIAQLVEPESYEEDYEIEYCHDLTGHIHGILIKSQPRILRKG